MSVGFRCGSNLDGVRQKRFVQNLFRRLRAQTWERIDSSEARDKEDKESKGAINIKE